MPSYQYKAINTEGKNIAGMVEAPGKEAAAKLLRDKHLFVVNLSEGKGQFSFAFIQARIKRVRFSDIVNFTRQLSTMVIAGLSIPEALNILRGQTTNPLFQKALEEIEHQIVGGSSLADALGKYSYYFSPIYVSLVRAGESSGTLDKVLVRLAETLEAEQEFRSKVRGAMVYPMIIVFGMGGVMMVMMTVVMPKLTELYKDFGVSLPLSTQILMSISDVFVRYWWLMIVSVVFGFFGFTKWRKTPIGQLAVDSLILRIPLFGELQKKIVLVEFTRTFGMLTASGIHILEGLRILKDSVGNVLYRNAITEIIGRVEKGFSLADSFAQYPIFPQIVSQMMKVGEETGKLDETLVRLSNYFQTESEHLVKGLTTAIEPIIMVVLGVGVGFIVISVITPIYNLTTQFK